MRTVPRIALAMLSLFITSFAVIGITAPANATDYYRYWQYFQVQDGTAVTSQKGPGAFTPEDGSVEAYRYAASKDFKKPNLPRVDLTKVTFDAVCADTAAADGQKRVAVILDYGVEEDAEGQPIPEPKAACAQVAATATGLQVLQAVAEVRTENHGGPLVCGIDGFPAKGCADEVTQTATPPDGGFLTVALGDAADQDATSGDSKDDDSNNTPLYVGLGVLVAALVAAGLFVTRRNKTP
jgi:hypothetical protein